MVLRNIVDSYTTVIEGYLVVLIIRPLNLYSGAKCVVTKSVILFGLVTMHVAYVILEASI